MGAVRSGKSIVRAKNRERVVVNGVADSGKKKKKEFTS